MVIAAPQHEERVSNDSFNFVRIEIKVLLRIPYNLLLSSLDSVGRLFWKNSAEIRFLSTCTAGLCRSELL